MTQQLKDIGSRLRALRIIEEYPPSEFAAKMGISETELACYECGEKDFSFSFLYNAASILEVDVLDLMSGDTPKLSGCCLVRGGEGFAIDRREAYSYSHLAYTFKDKLAEPFLVTVAPKEEKPTQHSHDGQEFDYVVSGKLRFYLEAQEYELNPGDSVYYNSGLPHAMQAVGSDPVSFLAVVIGPKKG